MKRISFLFDVFVLVFLFVPGLLPAQVKLRNNEAQPYSNSALASVRINDTSGMLDLVQAITSRRFGDFILSGRYPACCLSSGPNAKVKDRDKVLSLRATYSF